MNAEKLARTSSTEVELTKPYRSESGYCYRAALDSIPWGEELTQLGDSNEKPQQSPAVLLEDGQPIGPPHSPHRTIVVHGGGAYSHWSSAVYFSTSDNTDPNVNGRSYSLRINKDLARDQLLTESVVHFLRVRLSELGAKNSGFYDYYARFAETGKPFQAYDKAIARYILEHAFNYATYVEIGAGIGQLSALLAADGFHAVAVEGDRQRAEAARALQSSLAASIEGIGNNMSVIESFFPDPKVQIDRTTMVLFTNIIYSDNIEDALLKGCKDAGAIIIDICRFVRSRTTVDEWRLLIRRVRDMGFPYVDPVFSWGDATPENQPSPSPGRLICFHRGNSL